MVGKVWWQELTACFSHSSAPGAEHFRKPEGISLSGPSPTSHTLARGTPKVLTAGDQVFRHWSLQRSPRIENTTENEARLAGLYSETLSGLGKLGKQKWGWGLGDLCDMETFLVEKFGESSLCDSYLPVGFSWK